MEIVNRPYGRVCKGHTIPYGTLADASYELRKAYYYEGYPKDSDLPELPVMEPEDTTVDPEEVVIRHELCIVMEEMLGTLTPREAKVLCMRFGIGMSTDYTLEEVGRLFDVTRERIRQIEAKALRKLKHPSRNEKLLEFIDPKRPSTRHEKFMAEYEAQKKWAEMQRNMDLWKTVAPMLDEPGWLAHLRDNDHEMYERLEQLVVDVWGDKAKEIWDGYAQKK